jgi:hypothetical protein
MTEAIFLIFALVVGPYVVLWSLIVAVGWLEKRHDKSSIY